ncbi:MAG: PDZ domain-containing protein [Planctomycetes bacterium]|nr:PDZ domain-containing protein [Planctomycetota bacterium]
MKVKLDAVLLFVAASLSVVAVLVLTNDLLPHEGSPEAVTKEVARLIREEAVVRRDDAALAIAAANGMAAALDPYSEAWTAEENSAQSQRTAGHYAGIGVMLGETARGLTILDVAAGGPAAEVGLRPLDAVLAIDGIAVPEVQPIAHVRGRLAGEAGSKVVLRVRRADGVTVQDLVLHRATVDQPSAYGAMIDPVRRLGILVVKSFFKNTAEQAQVALAELKAAGLKGLVLDLRDNGGGLLDAGGDIARLFLGGGVLLVQTVGRAGSRALHAEVESPFGNLPLVVLVDGRTASSAEVVAAALQDHGRAPLIGSRTYGKGVVQRITALRSLPGAALRLTAAHHYAPSGRCIEKSIGVDQASAGRGGLIPDVAVPMGAAAQMDADILRSSWRYLPEVRAELRPQGPVQDAALDTALAILCGEAPADRKL